jgi:hypothetical protein
LKDQHTGIPDSSHADISAARQRRTGLGPHDRGCARGAAHGPDFTEKSRAGIQVAPLRLPSGSVVGLVNVEFNGPLPEVVCIVSLATSVKFRAVRQGSSQHEYYDIFRLDGAAVDGAANVTLADGTSLRAVNVIPAYLPLEPSGLDWRIVHHTIALIGAEDQCYRRLRDGLPTRVHDMVPDRRFLDCSNLFGLKTPPLKAIAAYIADHDPTLKLLSLQKIADALRNYGIRVPTPRPRVSASHASAAI